MILIFLSNYFFILNNVVTLLLLRLIKIFKEIVELIVFKFNCFISSINKFNRYKNFILYYLKDKLIFFVIFILSFISTPTRTIKKKLSLIE
jgi:hypothetical protein